MPPGRIPKGIGAEEKENERQAQHVAGKAGDNSTKGKANEETEDKSEKKRSKSSGRKSGNKSEDKPEVKSSNDWLHDDPFTNEMKEVSAKVEVQPETDEDLDKQQKILKPPHKPQIQALQRSMVEPRQKRQSSIVSHFSKSKSKGSSSPEKKQEAGAVARSQFAHPENPDEGKVTVRPRHDPPPAQPGQLQVPGSLGEVAAAQESHPIFNQRLGNRTAAMITSMSETDRQNFEYIQNNAPKKSIKTSREEGQRDSEAQSEIPWENTNVLNFLPRALGIHMNPTDGRVPSVGSPSLPHPPIPPIRPPFQTPVGITTGERGNSLTRKDKFGGQQLVDRRGLTAYLRMTSRQPGYEYCDATGQHLNLNHIWFDSDKTGLERQLLLARGLVEDWQTWRRGIYQKWADDMRAWRIQRRAAELALWKYEVDAGNWTIFNPHAVNPDTAEKLYDGLQEWVKVEDQRDHDHEIPDHHKGRPQRRSLNISYEEVMDLEKTYGSDLPVSDFDEMTESMAERLGMFNRTQPLDQRGNRLWRLGARRTQRARGQELTEWMARGSRGPRPYYLNPDWSEAKKIEWAIRDDEDFCNATFQHIREMINKRDSRSKLPNEDADEENEPLRATVPTAPRTRGKGTSTMKTPARRSRRIAKAAGKRGGDKDPDSSASSSEDDEVSDHKKSAGKGKPQSDEDSDDDQMDFEMQEPEEESENDHEATPKRKARSGRKSTSSKKRKTNKSGTTKADNKIADQLGQSQRKATEQALARRPKSGSASKTQPGRRALDMVDQSMLQTGSPAQAQSKTAITVRRQPDQGHDSQTIGRRVHRRPVKLVYESHLEQGRVRNIENVAYGTLTEVTPRRTNAEYMTGKWELDQREEIMEKLVKSAAKWLENQPWLLENAQEYGIPMRPGGRVNQAKLELEDVVKWAPVRITKSVPRGTTDKDGWEHWFMLERSDCLHFINKRIEAAYLQHPNSKIYAVGPDDNYELQDPLTGRFSMEDDLDVALVHLNNWYARDDLARRGKDVRIDPTTLKQISIYFGEAKLIQAMEEATWENVPDDIQDWLDKGAPSTVWPGSEELKQYVRPKTPTPPRKPTPGYVNISDIDSESESKPATTKASLGERDAEQRKIKQEFIEEIESTGRALQQQQEQVAPPGGESTFQRDSEADPEAYASNIADGSIEEVVPKMTDDEYLDGKFDLPERETIMKDIKKRAIQWIEDQGWTKEQLTELGIPLRPNSTEIRRSAFTYEHAVKWAPVQLIRSTPVGKDGADGWSHEILLERYDCGYFACKRIEAAYLQLYECDIRVAPPEHPGESVSLNAYRLVFDALFKFYLRDSLARKGQNVRAGDKVEKAIAAFWDQPKLQEWLHAAAYRNIPKVISEWLEKGAPQDVLPGANQPPNLEREASPDGDGDTSMKSEETKSSPKQEPPVGDGDKEMKDRDGSGSSDDSDEYTTADSKPEQSATKPGTPSRTATTEDKQSPVQPSTPRSRQDSHERQLMSGLAGQLDALTHRNSASPSRNRRSMTGDEFKQWMYGPRASTVSRAGSKDTQVMGEIPQKVDIGKNKPPFTSHLWYSHPQFELPADFPIFFGLIKPKELSEEESKKLFEAKPSLHSVWTSEQDIEFYRMKTRVDLQGCENRQVLYPRYKQPEGVYRCIKLKIDRDRNFFVNARALWDDQKRELEDVYTADGLRIAPVIRNAVPLRADLLYDDEMMQYDEAGQYWDANGSVLQAVPPNQLGEPTRHVALLPIRQGFCVHTTIHKLLSSEVEGLCFNVEDRYPWDRRRRLRLPAFDENGQSIDASTVVKPKNIPLTAPQHIDMTKGGAITDTNTSKGARARVGSGLRQSIES